MADGDAAPLEVFYSYSHDDEEYRKKLGKHLSVLRRAGLITDWHDRDIDAGTAWQEEIDRHLLLADIVLLLVSASFIASVICWGDEMETRWRATRRRRRGVPIILHPCGWLRTPLQALQGVPRDNKAISLWPNEHAAFDHVVTEIAKVVDDLRGSKTAEPEQSWRRPARSQSLLRRHLPLTPTLSRAREREILPRLPESLARLRDGPAIAGG